MKMEDDLSGTKRKLENKGQVTDFNSNILMTSNANEEYLQEQNKQNDQPKTKKQKAEHQRSSLESSSNDISAREPEMDLSKQDFLKEAEKLTSELEANGPAGLVHLLALCRLIERPVKVLVPEDQDLVIDEENSKEPVNVEYLPPEPGGSSGHWVLPGGHFSNNCLFDVVACQTEKSSNDLRVATVQWMRANLATVAEAIEVIEKLQRTQNIQVMTGGAKYHGSSERDAKKVIDNSQNQPCHAHNATGHPRGHASHPNATGPNDSVENYSMTGWKTGFLSRSDQDFVGHYVLKTPKVQRAIQELNEGATNQAVNVFPNELDIDLPKLKEYRQGVPISASQTIRSFTIVLRHHVGKFHDKDADVFVHTFYPRK